MMSRESNRFDDMSGLLADYYTPQVHYFDQSPPAFDTAIQTLAWTKAKRPR